MSSTPVTNSNENADTQVHLFTLRIWAAKDETSAPQWRSRLQNIQSGDVRFCKDLESLLRNLQDALKDERGDSVSG